MHHTEPTPINTCPSTPSTKTPLSTEAAQQQALLLKALADPSRLKLLSLLPTAPETSCICDLIPAINLSQPTVSHHFKVLTEAGLVSRQKRGTWVHYSLVPGALEKIANSILNLR
ncbi:ArsR/SmtB family transcription factor [Rothia sp. CCM 9417]|uniref:ArsR/SmtB family transcription factor n=1 Tax=Rothia sp. CCM 9417 TaxID=3402657 RepID=UPI003AE62E6C